MYCGSNNLSEQCRSQKMLAGHGENTVLYMSKVRSLEWFNQSPTRPPTGLFVCCWGLIKPLVGYALLIPVMEDWHGVMRARLSFQTPILVCLNNLACSLHMHPSAVVLGTFKCSAICIHIFVPQIYDIFPCSSDKLHYRRNRWNQDEGWESCARL